MSLAVYDKAKQLAEEYGIHLGYPLTRMEVRYSFKPTISIADLAELKNPFDDVRVFWLSAPGAPAGLRFLVNAAGCLGVDAVRRWFNPRHAEHFLRSIVIDAAIWPAHPCHVFDQRWPEAADRVLRLLCGASAAPPGRLSVIGGSRRRMAP